MSRLGDHIEVLSGYPFDSSRFADQGGFPLVRIRDVVPGKTSTYYAGDVDPAYLISDGDLLVGMDGNFNRGTWRGGPALLNQRVCCISARAQSLDNRYLFHFLPTALKAIEDTTSFATVKHLSVKTIREIPIEVPPLPQQRRIAGILDRVDELRAKRRRALALLDELDDAAFVDAFERQEWPVVPLELVASTQGGLTVNRARDASRRKVDYLRVANVSRGLIDMTEVKQIGVTDAEFDRTCLEDGDILLVEGHGNHREVGRAARWSLARAEVVHQNHLIRVRASASSLDPIYLERYLNGAKARSYFYSVAKTTSGLNTINMTNVKDAPVPVPPLEMQQQFAARCREIEKIRSVHRSHLSEIDQLFASLQHRAFSGQM